MGSLGADEARAVYAHITGSDDVPIFGAPVLNLGEVYRMARKDGWAPNRQASVGQYA